MTDAARLRAIDADGHILERQSDVRRHLEAPWKDRTTSLDPGGQPWDDQMSGKIEPPYGYGYDLSPEEQVAIWNKAMDDHDIEKAVLFPTFAQSYGKLQEVPFSIAVTRAANSLFAKEFRTERLIPVGVLPMRDPQASAREIERAVNELGITAFEVATDGLPVALGDSYYDPVYAMAQRLGAAICIHGTRVWGHEFGGARLKTFAEFHTYCFTAGILLQFTSVICQGVIRRFPDLRLAFLEIGATWLPYYLDRIDEHWVKRRSEMPDVPRKPSDEFRESSIIVSIEADESLLAETVGFVGAEHLVYATDIPHWDCEFPDNLITLRKLPSLSNEVKQKILYDNAKAFYRL